jgi:predicted transcriptional regulator
MNSDKERILSIIANIIERSRTQAQPSRRLTRNLLLEYMNQRRPSYAQMSRDEFQNYFTTRPDRRTMIPAEDLVCVIEVILECSPGSASAQEILELCDAGRLPIREFRRLARFFSFGEWNNAWKLYDAAKISIGTDDVDFVDRIALVTDIYNICAQESIVCISGVSGIGKTRIGLKVCTIVESVDKHRVIVLSGHNIVGIESFVEQLCLALHITPIGNESLLFRLQLVARTTKFFVFIDDLVGKTNDEMLGLLRHIVHLIEHIQILVITVLPLTTDNNLGVCCFVVEPISMEESMLLFKQTCQQIGVFPRESSILAGKIRQCEGNPLAIKLMAYSLTQASNVVTYDLRLYRILASLSDIERQVVDTIVLFDSFVSVQFVKQVLSRHNMSDSDVFTIIHGLVRKGIVTIYEYNRISLHAVARVWYQHQWDYAQWSLQRKELIRQLASAYKSAIDDPEIFHFERNDWFNLVEIIHQVIKDADIEVDLMVNVLFEWREVWIKLGFHAKIVLLCEQLKERNFADEVHARFLLLYGGMLWRCGSVLLACEVLIALEVQCTLVNQMQYVGLCKIELARAYTVDGNIHFAQVYTHQAITMFRALQATTHIVVAYTLLAQLQLYMRQHHDVIATCTLIERTLQPLDTYTSARVAYLRAVVLIVTQKYNLAYQYINDAYTKYQLLSLETHIWDVAIIHALCYVLDGQLHDAQIQLQRIIKKIEYFNHQQILNTAECVALYCMKTESDSVAWQLMHLFVTNMAQQGNVYLLCDVSTYKTHMNTIRQLNRGVLVSDEHVDLNIWHWLLISIKRTFAQHASLSSSI